MTLIELVKLADEGYEKASDNLSVPLTEQCYPDGTPLKLDDYAATMPGDTLGRYIVIELAETFDPDASDEDQIAEAIRVMERGRDDMSNVVDRLHAKAAV